MNSLSWMIYLADVAGNISTTCGVVGGFALGSALLWPVGRAFVNDCIRDKPVHDPRPKWLVPLAVAGFTIASVVPTQNTIYAIAASEMGEKALNTETGGKAVKALNAWLDKQIGEEPEAEKSE